MPLHKTMNRIQSNSVLLIMLSFYCMAASQGCSKERDSETKAIELQIRLFDIIAKENPYYDDTLTAILNLDPSLQEQRFALLEERNARNPQIASLIDSLLTCDAYQLYYRQFRNVTPDIHRNIFNALPYRGINSPAGIGQVQFELFRNREGLLPLTKCLLQVDKSKAVAIADKWSPGTDVTVPPTYYILDGNGDAFARDGIVCFDLYGLILSKRPESSRYADLAMVSVAEIEAVLAHEYQHVFAQPFLYPSGRRFASWNEQWEDVIIRRMVSEGIAMQCNPPTGFKKAIFEDSAVVSYWLRELERVIGQIRRDEITSDSASAWLERNYQDAARKLLVDYLARKYPDADQRALLGGHIMDRPSAIYTMGWWMLSHIVAAPSGHNNAMELLTSPSQLFEKYNATASDTIFRIDL